MSAKYILFDRISIVQQLTSKKKRTRGVPYIPSVSLNSRNDVSQVKRELGTIRTVYISIKLIRSFTSVTRKLTPLKRNHHLFFSPSIVSLIYLNKYLVTVDSFSFLQIKSFGSLQRQQQFIYFTNTRYIVTKHHIQQTQKYDPFQMEPLTWYTRTLLSV